MMRTHELSAEAFREKTNDGRQNRGNRCEIEIRDHPGSEGDVRAASHPRRGRRPRSLAGSVQGNFPCEEDSLVVGSVRQSGWIATGVDRVDRAVKRAGRDLKCRTSALDLDRAALSR